MARRRAGVGIDLRELGFLGRALDATVGRVQSLGQSLGRLGSQKGSVKAGGGRGVFGGTLKDFLTRDEFVGRAGTIGRGLKAGRLGGSLLAFMSIEELGRNLVGALQGDKAFRDIMKDQLQFLLPSFLKDTLPAILDEFRIEIAGIALTGMTREERLFHGSVLDLHMEQTRKLVAVKDTEQVRELFRREGLKDRSKEIWDQEIDDMNAWGN